MVTCWMPRSTVAHAVAAIDSRGNEVSPNSHRSVNRTANVPPCIASALRTEHGR